MIKTEQIQTHEIVDKYRIKDGLILEVFKYKPINDVYIHNFDKSINKIVRGCKGLRILKEDYYDSYKDILTPSGTYIYGSRFVIADDDSSNYKYELKSSGGSVFGTKIELLDVLKAVEEILASYGK